MLKTLNRLSHETLAIGVSKKEKKKKKEACDLFTPDTTRSVSWTPLVLWFQPISSYCMMQCRVSGVILVSLLRYYK
jgi:hypothetical protein